MISHLCALRAGYASRIAYFRGYDARFSTCQRYDMNLGNMKNWLAVLSLLFCCACTHAQNIEGQIVASQYGRWRVPGYQANTYNSFAPNSCRVQGGASFFEAFTVGTPVEIVDSQPSMSEVVVPTSAVQTNVTCSVTIAPVNDHQVPFYFTSATGGLQEALNNNLTSPQSNTVILDNAFYQLLPAGTSAAAVIGLVKGGPTLGLIDITTTPTNWYRWNGSQYVLVPIGSGGGSLGTLQNDVLANNSTSTAAIDLYNFYATSTYSPASAIAAAEAHNGSATLTNSVGRKAFTNTGNVHVDDLRTDVPASARGATEFGAQCDLQNRGATFTQGSTAINIGGIAMDQSYVGRVIVAVGNVSGTPTVFESTIATVVDSLDATVTTAFPFSQPIPYTVDIGHDDTAPIAQGMSAVGGGGTLIFPQGNCLTQTQTLNGQSIIGVGPNSFITGFPGEDMFAAPDPSITTGVNQGTAHIHDLSFNLDQRIDATQAWQLCAEASCTTKQAAYRPIATQSGVANNPLAPGWIVGASNGVASTTASSAVMCVPSSQTPPAVGSSVVFPYFASVFTATVNSTSGSCAAGSVARTLSANLPSTTSQSEWFAGTSVQNLSTAITSGSCPTTITLNNSINPVSGFESNVAPFGLIQIDGEQFSYFGKSNAQNPSPANTLYGVQCAQNGTTRANHSTGATVVPLNPFKPNYPWPVVPTLNSGDTTPAGTAGFFPGWNVGNAVFAFPLANGRTAGAYGAWGPNSAIENISAFYWPSDINGNNWEGVNHGALFYFVSPPYGAKFRNISTLFTFYGLTEGAPSIENGNWAQGQPTADGTTWDQVALWAANPVNMVTGGQNAYSNFNVYSQESTTTGSALGADTCFYFTHTANDQTGGVVGIIGNTEFHNLYCEPEGGPHATKMPQWEWDTIGSQVYDQHMGGGGEVYLGGAQQHWISGNFNNAPSTPTLNFGSGNTADYVTNLGSDPKGTTYGTNSFINWGFLTRFSGTTNQAFSQGYGPYGNLGTGSTREAIPSQTNTTFDFGNLTAPFTSSEGGFITPEEFNTNFSYESEAMNVGWTFDPNSPITNAYAGCNVGNNAASIYCNTYKFNLQSISIGAGQRLVPGKYELYMSLKDAVTSSNTAKVRVFSNCGGWQYTVTPAITNAWPTTRAAMDVGQVDLTTAGGAGCVLQVAFFGATTADQIQIGFMDFAPVAESFNAQTINVTNINTPNGTGCAQSPITGINGGYTCPTKGGSTSTAASQGVSDTTITVSSTIGLSPSGCFYVDAEYECYSTIVSGTVLGGLSRGAYTTTATTHSSGAGVIFVSLVLGSTAETPSNVIAYGQTSPPILTANNGFPYNHGGSSVFSVNQGNNELWVNTAGAITQQNAGAQSTFNGTMVVGNVFPYHPDITDTGYLLQSNIPGTATSPQSLAGGHAGSLNVIQPATIGAPGLQGALPSGSSSASWVCSGLDVDGNSIPGTTTTVTSVASTWNFPQGISVGCPWSAGVVTYQIWRTAGGGSQGLLGSGTGTANGYWLSDFGGATSGGTPPASNTSNPHISVAGSGNPTITMGSGGSAPTITFSTAAPSGSCNSGSMWSNSSSNPSTFYVCQQGLWTPGVFARAVSAGAPVNYFDEFLTGANTAVNPIGSPSGDSCAVNTTYADLNHPGQILLTSGTGGSGTGVTCGTQTESADFATPNSASANWTWETAVYVPVLPGTTAGAFQAGLSTGPNANPWTGGIQFYLSSANGVANDWYCRYSTTSTDSTVAAAAGTWTRLTMVNDGTYLHWYINGTEATGCKTAIASIPSASQYAASWSATALSATSVTMAVDYVSIQRQVTR
jgi:hypothetical protein